MNREHVILERRGRAPQPALQPPDLSDPVQQPVDVRVYLTTRELADYLGYRGKRAQVAAQKFVQRKGLRRRWRSARVSLVRRADVDAVLKGMPVRHDGRVGE